MTLLFSKPFLAFSEMPYKSSAAKAFTHSFQHLPVAYAKTMDQTILSSCSFESDLIFLRRPPTKRDWVAYFYCLRSACTMVYGKTAQIYQVSVGKVLH